VLAARFEDYLTWRHSGAAAPRSARKAAERIGWRRTLSLSDARTPAIALSGSAFPAFAGRAPGINNNHGNATRCGQATSVLTALVISASAFFASAKYMLVFGLT